ncbi:MAG: hypothetical protein IJ190_05465 [Prevotella sp.]|nr:hypothetical protein [Prevotella sp.]
MKNLYWYIWGLLLVVSCSEISQKDSAAKDIRVYPGVYDVDSVRNIIAYFDSLYHEYGADIWTHNPEVGESIEVWNAVKELHRYVNHQRKFYPAEEIFQAMEVMTFEQGYAYSHSGEDPDSVNNGRTFRFADYNDGYKIVFNPDKLTWNYCLPKQNVYQKVNGTKTLGLSLDWQNSRFYEMLQIEAK